MLLGRALTGHPHDLAAALTVFAQVRADGGLELPEAHAAAQEAAGIYDRAIVRYDHLDGPRRDAHRTLAGLRARLERAG